MDKFGKFIIITSLILATTLSMGYVFSTLWTWFIIPIFELPSLTVIQAIGIVFVTRTLIPTTKIDTDPNFSISKYVISFLVPWITFGVGFIFHLFL